MADAFQRRMFNNQMQTNSVGRFSRAIESGQGGTNTNYGRSPHVRGTGTFNSNATSQFNAEYGGGGTNKPPASQSRNLLETWKDKIKNMPGSQPAKPNPYAAKPTGQLTQKNAGALLGLGSMTVTGAVTAPLILGGSEDASRKWSRLGYSSPEAYQKAVSQNANRERPITADNPISTDKPIQPRIERKPGPFDEGYVKPNTTMEPTEEATLSQYLNPGPRQETRTNGNDVKQDGLKLSGGVSAAFVPEYANSSFNQMLTTVNKGQFSSNQLPGTEGDPFSGTAPKTQSFNTEAESVTGNSLNDFYYDGNETMLSSRESTSNDTFNPNAARIEGGSSRKPGPSLQEALADKDGINSYMSQYSDGDRQRAANRAFLDTEGSMAGLRAKEAVNNTVYAGGQHYVPGENADSPAIGISRDNARDISNGKAKAQDFLAKKTADTVAAVKQSPALLEEGAKNGAFQQDKPMFSGSTPAIGGAVEFDNNNSQTLPTFGAPKGYKPQSTYKDPSFPNPFG